MTRCLPQWGTETEWTPRWGVSANFCPNPLSHLERPGGCISYIGIGIHQDAYFPFRQIFRHLPVLAHPLNERIFFPTLDSLPGLHGIYADTFVHLLPAGTSLDQCHQDPFG